MRFQFFTICCSALMLVSFVMADGTDFRHIPPNHLKNERVGSAANRHYVHLVTAFNELGISFPPQQLYLRAFKLEGELEVWASASEQEQMKLFKTYAICAKSGELGPKRREGDRQVPEGCYEIDRFNPLSKFHLSTRISYPNQSDRIRGDQNQPGGDIYIHGDCVTIGCLPITDDKMEELYLLLAAASRPGAAVPIHIFPARMEVSNFAFQMHKHYHSAQHNDFWNELRPIYRAFNKSLKVPEVIIRNDGSYVLNS